MTITAESVPHVLLYEPNIDVYTANSPEIAIHISAATSEPGVRNFHLRSRTSGPR